MFNQYGSVLCISCESSMRLATIEPGEAGTSTATFECRYPPCAKSRVMVIGEQQDAPSGGFGLFLRDGMEAPRAETGFSLADLPDSARDSPAGEAGRAQRRMLQSQFG
jgi:hypothetical protein